MPTIIIHVLPTDYIHREVLLDESDVFEQIATILYEKECLKPNEFNWKYDLMMGREVQFYDAYNTNFKSLVSMNFDEDNVIVNIK